jgi:hypothetical protein
LPKVNGEIENYTLVQSLQDINSEIVYFTLKNDSYVTATRQFTILTSRITYPNGKKLKLVSKSIGCESAPSSKFRKTGNIICSCKDLIYFN